MKAPREPADHLPCPRRPAAAQALRLSDTRRRHDRRRGPALPPLRGDHREAVAAPRSVGGMSIALETITPHSIKRLRVCTMPECREAEMERL